MKDRQIGNSRVIAWNGNR